MSDEKSKHGAIDHAKYFLKNVPDTRNNTFDGNMKLHKLLLFANLIHMAEQGVPLFDDPIYAFAQGCEVEGVRQRLRFDHCSFIDDCNSNPATYSQSESHTLSLACEIFGDASARELSDINRDFEFWQTAYKASETQEGYRDKEKSIVTTESMLNECDRIGRLVITSEQAKDLDDLVEVVNDIEFCYDRDKISITDELLDRLYKFSLTAEDESYSISYFGDRLVIY
ncbi:MAG: hypothetical protein LBT59_08355 [Clostridiales bacterium]|jgi:uncharacterized phage-associated protein|nr:hypothetical protein [Clostridiales bacterium]